MLTITQEVPPQAAQQTLIEAVDATPYIAQLTQSELNSWIDAQTICFAYLDAACVGFAAWQPIGNRWVELGPYVVPIKAQGRGVGRALVQASLEHTRTHQHYAVSKNPAMQHLLLQHQFSATPFAQLPLRVKIHLLRRVLSPRLLAYLQQSGDAAKHYVRRHD